MEEWDKSISKMWFGTSERLGSSALTSPNKNIPNEIERVDKSLVGKEKKTASVFTSIS